MSVNMLPKTYQPDTQLHLKNGIYKTNFKGVFYIDQLKFKDQRGWYAEQCRIPELDAYLDNPFTVKQVNLSLSKTNVIRGFHAESWNKLILPLTGRCLSVLADLRPNSKTFGQVIYFEFSLNNGGLSGSIFVPAGVANSFYVINGPVNYLYFVDQLYKERDPKGDLAINLFDPDLNVKWPVAKSKMIISDRDLNSVSLREKFPEKFPEKL